MISPHAATINHLVHGLLLGGLGFLAVRLLVRDPRRQAIAALSAALVVALGPWLTARGPGIANETAGIDLPAPALVQSVGVHDTHSPPAQSDSAASVSSVSSVSEHPSTRPRTARTSLFHDWLPRLPVWLPRIWGVGMLAAALPLLWQWGALRRWRRRWRKPTASEWDALPEAVRVLAPMVFDEAGGPCVAGVFRPALALPAAVIGKLSASEWTWLVRHETEHLKARDPMWAGILALASVLAWWNPFVRLLAGRWALVRERVCDASAVGSETALEDYSDFLLSMAAGGGGRPALVFLALSRPARSLRDRLRYLLAAEPVRADLGAWFMPMLAGAVLAAVGMVSCVGLRQSPDLSGMRTRSYPAHFPIAPPAGVGKTWLVGLGVPFPPGADAFYDPALSRLVVRNTPANLTRIETLLPAALAIPAQINFGIRILEGERSFGPGVRPLSEAERQEVLQGRTLKVIDQLNLPSVTTRSGLPCEPAMFRESGQPDRFLGLKLGIAPETSPAETYYCSCDLTMGLEAGKKLSLCVESGRPEPDWSKVEMFRCLAGLEFGPGQTLLLPLEFGTRHLALLVTATPIDPTGRPKPDFGKLEPRPLHLDPEGKFEHASGYFDELQAAHRAREQARFRIETLVADLPEDQAHKFAPAADIQTDPVNAPWVLKALLSSNQYAVVRKSFEDKGQAQIRELKPVVVRAHEEGRITGSGSFPQAGIGTIRLRWSGTNTMDVEADWSVSVDGSAQRGRTVVTIFPDTTVLFEAPRDPKQPDRRRFLFLAITPLDPAPTKPE